MRNSKRRVRKPAKYQKVPHIARSITLAVMSDLHCHLQEEKDSTNQLITLNDSFLKVGALRSPVTHHPIEALLFHINSLHLKAGALLVPGDLSNRASQEGLSQAWDFALEVGRALNVNHVIPVLGNHDIDSYGIRNVPSPVHVPQFLRPGFPFNDAQSCSQFFAQGYCTTTIAKGIELLAINTVIDYTNKEVAKRGSFSAERIAELEAFMAKLPPPEMRIAMMHHHPILHSTKFLNDEDVIPTGDLLVAALRRLRCGFIVHGHKHQPKLTVVDTPSGNIPVFACGSFSAMLGEISSVARNLFHIIQLETVDSAGVLMRGTIRSWEWAKGEGWVTARLFPPRIGFGRQITIDDLVTGLRLLGERGRTHTHHQIIAAVPDLSYATDSELRQIASMLQDRLDFRFEEGVFQLGRFR